MALNPRYNGLHRNPQTGAREMVVNGVVVQTYTTTGIKIGAVDPYTLPLVDGGAGEVLKTNGSGVVAWAADEDSA